MKTIEVLQKARELLSDPNRWTQHQFARDAENLPVVPTSQSAFCFCSSGAIRRVIGSDHLFDADSAEVALAEAIKPQFEEFYVEAMDVIAEFNDEPTRRHEDILAKFDEAIAQLTVTE